MLKLNKDQKREPIGGHHFTDNGRLFKADSFSELIIAVHDYRINNGFAVGDPKQDILRYYESKFPYMVLPDPDAVPNTLSNDYVAWRNWVSKTWVNPPKKTITTKEAADRWAKCLTCPFNRAFDWDDTEESDQISNRAFLLRRGIDVPPELGFCGLHNADLSVFTIIDQAKPFSSKKEGGCDDCWV